MFPSPHFSLFFGKNGRLILRAKDEKTIQTVTHEKRKNPLLVMVWWCISVDGMGDLQTVYVKVPIDAQAYVRILERHMFQSR